MTGLLMSGLERRVWSYMIWHAFVSLIQCVILVAYCQTLPQSIDIELKVPKLTEHNFDEAKSCFLNSYWFWSFLFFSLHK